MISSIEQFINCLRSFFFWIHRELVAWKYCSLIMLSDPQKLFHMNIAGSIHGFFDNIFYNVIDLFVVDWNPGIGFSVYRCSDWGRGAHSGRRITSPWWYPHCQGSLGETAKWPQDWSSRDSFAFYLLPGQIQVDLLYCILTHYMIYWKSIGKFWFSALNQEFLLVFCSPRQVNQIQTVWLLIFCLNCWNKVIKTSSPS